MHPVDSELFFNLSSKSDVEPFVDFSKCGTNSKMSNANHCQCADCDPVMNCCQY